METNNGSLGSVVGAFLEGFDQFARRVLTYPVLVVSRAYEVFGFDKRSAGYVSDVLCHRQILPAGAESFK